MTPSIARVRRTVVVTVALVLAAVALGMAAGTVGRVLVIDTNADGLAIRQSAFALDAPAVSDAAARAAALRALAELDARNGKPAASYAIRHSHYAPGVVSTKDTEGNMSYSTQPPVDSYVIEVTAPGDGMYTHIKGLVVVDAVSGKVQGVQVARYNS